MHAPRLTVAEREALWRPQFAGAEVDPEVAAMPLSPEQIVSVARHARAMADLHGEGGDHRRADPHVDPPARPGSGRAGRPGRVGDRRRPDPRRPRARRDRPAARLGPLPRRDRRHGPLHGKGGKGSGIARCSPAAPAPARRWPRNVIAEELSASTCSRSTCRRSWTSTSARPRRTWRRCSPTAEALDVVLFFDEADALFGCRSEVQGRRATGTPTRRSPTCCSGWSSSTASPSWPPTCAATSTRPSPGG